VRLNALKHGLTAATVVLPGEDPAALEARVEAWKDDFGPGGAIEDYLVERAAHAAWQLDRADRAIAVRARDRRRREADDLDDWEADEVAALGRALFWDRRGPLPLYPHRQRLAFEPRPSWTDAVEDPLDPPRLLRRLEAFAAGCRWLLDRWAELRAILEDGRKWQPPDRFRAVRLLGKQPLDVLDDEPVLSLYLACHAMDPTGPSPFADQVRELVDEDVAAFKNGWRAGWLRAARPRIRRRAGPSCWRSWTGPRRGSRPDSSGTASGKPPRRMNPRIAWRSTTATRASGCGAISSRPAGCSFARSGPSSRCAGRRAAFPSRRRWARPP
jgi:hypothetical protein